MDYLTQFNDTLLELINDLIRVFPQDGDFRMYKLALQAAIIADSNLVHEVFRDRVCRQFGDKVLARDEDFFINNNYNDMKDEFSQAEQLIQKLKSCWITLTPDQRDIIWKYFRVLVLLDRKIA